MYYVLVVRCNFTKSNAPPWALFKFFLGFTMEYCTKLRKTSYIKYEGTFCHPFISSFQKLYPEEG